MSHLEKVSKTNLFDAVDKDASGMIDKKEFGQLYDMIKKEMEEEVAKEQALESGIRKSKKYNKMLGVISATLLATLAMSVAANCAVFYVVSNALKDTEIHGAEMTTRDNQTVATGQAVTDTQLTELPAMADPAVYNGMNFVTLNDGATGQMSARISSWKWKSPQSMYISLDDGSDVLIHQNNVYHVTTNGVVSFDAAGSPHPAVNVGSALVTAATTKCAEIGCAASQCVVSTSEMGLSSATCSGHELWNYKNDDVAALHARKMPFPAIAAGVVARVVVRAVAAKIMRGSSSAQ